MSGNSRGGLVSGPSCCMGLNNVTKTCVTQSFSLTLLSSMDHLDSQTDCPSELPGGCSSSRPHTRAHIQGGEASFPETHWSPTASWWLPRGLQQSLWPDRSFSHLRRLGWALLFPKHKYGGWERGSWHKAHEMIPKSEVGCWWQNSRDPLQMCSSVCPWNPGLPS